MTPRLALGLLGAAAAAFALFFALPRLADAGDAPAAVPPLPLSPHQGGHLSTGDPRSAVVMPEQRIDIAFDHAKHLRDLELTCDACHGSVKTSATTKDLNLPARSVCMDCHDPEEVPKDWGPRLKDSAIVMPAAHLSFSHERHLGAGVTCAECHAGVGETKLATRDHLPSMETCIACHASRGVTTECRACHAKGQAGTIRTTFASGTLVPDDHGVHWLKQHAVAAERDMGQCASCHAQEDCLSCHDGAIPPTFHAGNYLALHPQDAMANNPPCASCHRLERFCRDCHFRAGVTLGNPLVSGITGSFHPADWLNAGTPDFHGNVGRKNLASCSGCHVKEDCVGCHAFYQGAPRIHPPGWASSRRMRQLREANFSMCLQCHGFGEPGDPVTRP